MSLLPQPVVATDAVVLRTWPSGETSLVVSLLTARCGYLRAVAKGARSAASALRPLAQPGRLIAAECSLAPARELQYLRAGQLLLDPLAGDEPAAGGLERLAFLLAAVEIVDRCRPSGEREEELFALCRDFLGVLSCAPRDRAAQCFYAFELALLGLQGLAPVLGACAACAAAQPAAGAGGLWFDPAAGGVVCGACAAAGRARAGHALPRDTLLALQVLPRELAGTAEAPPPLRRVQREIGVMLHRFLGYHLPAYRLPAALDLLRPARRAEAAQAGGRAAVASPRSAPNGSPPGLDEER